MQVSAAPWDPVHPCTLVDLPLRTLKWAQTPDPSIAMSLTIRLKRNGPYVISVEDAPNVVILDADGNVCVPEAGRSIALCRCGGSATKPFCDRTHREIGFCDPEVKPAADPVPGSTAQ